MEVVTSEIVTHTGHLAPKGGRHIKLQLGVRLEVGPSTNADCRNSELHSHGSVGKLDLLGAPLGLLVLVACVGSVGQSQVPLGKNEDGSAVTDLL